MNKNEFETLIQNLPNHISPYKLGKLEKMIRQNDIPTQKIYNYIRQNYIIASKNELGKLQIEKKEFTKYLSKFITN